MRPIARFSLMFAFACLALPAQAQSPLEGPLASPAHAAKPARAKTKPRHTAAKKTPPADARPDERPRAVPTATPQSSDPTSPVSLGMKWNGNNDNPVQTRTQNYGGDAQGAGAEVGLKLHF